MGKVGLAMAMMMCSIAPALAADCGNMPAPPVLISVSDLDQKSPADASAAKHDAVRSVLSWQHSLVNYRSCLDDALLADKRIVSRADSSKDASLIAATQSDEVVIQTRIDDSISTEGKIVNEVDAIRDAYCARRDVDRTGCPK